MRKDEQKDTERGVCCVVWCVQKERCAWACKLVCVRIGVRANWSMGAKSHANVRAAVRKGTKGANVRIVKKTIGANRRLCECAMRERDGETALGNGNINGNCTGRCVLPTHAYRQAGRRTD